MSTFNEFYESYFKKLIIPDLVADDENVVVDDDDDNIFYMPNDNVDINAAELQRACFVKEVRDYSLRVSNYYKGKTPEKVDTWRNSFSVLDFWFEIKEQFPILSALATRNLEIPAQESCSERTFSGLTNLLTKARGSIKPQLAGEMVINYMKKHRSRQSKLMPYPPLGKDWPESLKGFVRLPPRDDEYDAAEDNAAIDNVIENVDVQDRAAEDNGIENGEEQDDAEEEIEDGIYPDDDDQQPQRPQRSATLDYAAMSRGLGRY